MIDKATLRADIFAKLQQLSSDQIQDIDSEISRRVLSLPSVKRAKAICIYESFGREVNTKELIQTFHSQGKTVVVPPKNPKEIDIASIDLWIVPGVAFDMLGNRLGRGGGYYDRVLAYVKNPTIGIAREVQIVPRLPKEKYDIPVITVVTEKNLYGHQTP
jgi:5-formyltetrahydrofolate cyclo-ligase